MRRVEYTIEFPARGATYRHQRAGVYRLDTYPRGSVLAGQQRRTFLRSFDTVAEAVAHYPQATIYAEGGTSYQPPDLSHLPFDPDYDQEDY